jgi:hypothetical protein
MASIGSMLPCGYSGVEPRIITVWRLIIASSLPTSARSCSGDDVVFEALQALEGTGVQAVGRRADLPSLGKELLVRRVEVVDQASQPGLAVLRVASTAVPSLLQHVVSGAAMFGSELCHGVSCSRRRCLAGSANSLADAHASAGQASDGEIAP